MLIRFAIHVASLLFVFSVVWNVHRDVLGAAIIMALILALVNAVVKPVLVILTLPVTILTLGLFLVVLNAFLFALSLWLLGILGFHFAIPFSRIILGWLIYVLISTVLTHII